MLSKKALKAVRETKALQGKTLGEICDTPEFLQNLKALLNQQVTERKLAEKSARITTAFNPGKYHLPTHPIQQFMEHTAEQFKEEYLAVIGKQSSRPSGERLFIEQLGGQAYNLTMVQFIVAEHPEVAEEFGIKPAN